MLTHPATISRMLLILLGSLLALAMITSPAHGQFEAIVLPRADDMNHAEATGISRDGVVAGYGWGDDDDSPRRGLRWTPNYQTVEAPDMNGNLFSVVFNGIDPLTEWPFGAAVGGDTGGDVHAIQVDEILPDGFLPDVHHADWTDRHPGGFSESEMFGGVAAYRVGDAVPNSGSLPHAVLWETGGWTATDLHPAGYSYSTAAAIALDNTAEGPYYRVAGWAEQQGLDRAMSWSFSDPIFITPLDRHPGGYDSSRAYGVSSRWTVGAASPANSGTQHAVLFGFSGATDLNPSWSSYSKALGASDAGIVGFSGSGLYGRMALYWSTPDPAQVTDLHQFVPAGYIASYAVALNDAKRIVGTVIDASGERHPVLWRPVSRFWLAFRVGFARYAQVVDARIVLDRAAPVGGFRVKLSPTSGVGASAWSLQPEVVVPEGKTSAVFRVATTDRRPAKPVRATITASWGKEVRRATLTVNP
jgi:hypothetical protein